MICIDIKFDWFYQIDVILMRIQNGGRSKMTDSKMAALLFILLSSHDTYITGYQMKGFSEKDPNNLTYKSLYLIV